MKGTLVQGRVILEDRIVLAGAALVLMVLGGMTWLLFADYLFPKADAELHYTHMHCPECGEEIPYNTALEGEPCVACQKGNYLPTVGPFQEGKKKASLGTRLVIFFLFAGLLGEGLAFLSIWRFGEAAPGCGKGRKPATDLLLPVLPAKTGLPNFPGRHRSPVFSVQDRLPFTSRLPGRTRGTRGACVKTGSSRDPGKPL